MSDLIQTASYDQFTDFRTVDEMTGSESRVIFSYQAYMHFLELISKSKTIGGETGCYFIGKELGKNTNQIFIDSYTSEFRMEDGFVRNGSVVDSEVQREEVRRQVQQRGADCVFHFHVHPQLGHFDVFSDQDLEIYRHRATEPKYQFYSNDEIRKILGQSLTDEQCEKWRKTFDGTTQGRDTFRSVLIDNKKVSYFGILASPDRTNSGTGYNNYQFSIAYCNPRSYSSQGKMQSDFYRFPSMFYLDKENTIKKVGTFERRVLPILTTARRLNDRKVNVQGIGKNPNTGGLIQDIEVGKYIDGQFVFARTAPDRVTPQELSAVARNTGERESGLISRGIKNVANIVRGLFNKDKDRTEN